MGVGNNLCVVLLGNTNFLRVVGDAEPYKVGACLPPTDCAIQTDSINALTGIIELLYNS